MRENLNKAFEEAKKSALDFAADQDKKQAAAKEERDVAVQRAAAIKKGAEALREFNKQQFVADALRQHGAFKNNAERDEFIQFKKDQFEAANQVESVWKKALDKVGESAVGLFSSLADGGIAGLVDYAKSQSKLFLAEALGNVARGLGFLAFPGGPVGADKAKDAFAAAAADTAAAAAFGAFGAIGGGGASSGSTPSAGGAGSAGTSAQPAGADVTIVLQGHFDALSPKVQDVVFGAMQEARQRYGNNATIRVVKKR
jgi:hypothetical protein